MLDFDAVQAALEKLNCNVNASEAHGTLCGLLLENSDMATWLKHTLDDLPDAADVLATEQLRLLKQLFEQSREQLNNVDMSFELLLPEESDDFGVRLLALSEWCQGFLYSTGIIGLGKARKIDELSQECLSDLLEISKLDHRQDGDDDAEKQYIEIVEHVRMSTLMLNESVNPVMASPALQ
ncbi:MAG: UPF0149 family protein [Gammaproteobacteria bacterium]|nr:UPF0149 family protein [Gammaproteobacteria bacterium]